MFKNFIKKLKKYFSGIGIDNEHDSMKEKFEQAKKQAEKLSSHRDKVVHELKRARKELKNKNNKLKQLSRKNRKKEEIESLKIEIENLEKLITELTEIKVVADEEIEQIYLVREKFHRLFLEELSQEAVTMVNENFEKAMKTIQKTGDYKLFEKLEKDIEPLEYIEKLNLDRFLEYSEEDILKRDPEDLKVIIEELNRVWSELSEALPVIRRMEEQLIEDIERSRQQKETWISRKAMAMEAENPEMAQQAQFRIDEYDKAFTTFENELPFVSANRKKVEDADAKLCLILEKITKCLEKKKA